MSFSLIACIGKNNELGKDGDLVFHLKQDMAFFRKTTINHTVVMGRKTFESLKNGALPKRKNIVITSSPNFRSKNVEIVTNLNEFIKKYKNAKEEIFIIGGASIYSAFLPFSDTLYLTEVDKSTDADVFFPNFNILNYDKKILEEGAENGVNFTITKYTVKH